MIQQCPNCGEKIALDEQRYNAGDIVIRRCPRCGNDVEFTITDTADTLWKEELRRQELELAALLEKRKNEILQDSSSTKKRSLRERLSVRIPSKFKKLITIIREVPEAILTIIYILLFIIIEMGIVCLPVWGIGKLIGLL